MPFTVLVILVEMLNIVRCACMSGQCRVGSEASPVHYQITVYRLCISSRDCHSVLSVSKSVTISPLHKQYYTIDHLCCFSSYSRWKSVHIRSLACSHFGYIWIATHPFWPGCTVNISMQNHGKSYCLHTVPLNCSRRRHMAYVRQISIYIKDEIIAFNSLVWGSLRLALLYLAWVHYIQLYYTCWHESRCWPIEKLT